MSASARVQGSRRIAAVPVCACRPQHQQRSVATRAAASDPAAFDFSEFAEDLDVNVSAGVAAPLATENVRLRIRMRAYDTNLLADAVADMATIADVTGAEFKGPVMLPTRKKIYCVLRSPHVNKDAREHFEVRTHHRLVDFKKLSALTVEALMQWVPPPGVEMESSICTNATGGNQLRRLQQRQAAKAAMA